MDKKILISCDSTADLSFELAEAFQIKILPQPILVDERICHDMVDITPLEIFEHVKNTGRMAKTSAPNIMDYVEYFRPLAEEGYEVIHFNISSQMSVTHANCRNAAAEFEGIYAIDSKNLSTGIALQAIYAARLRDEGLAAPEIVRAVEEYRERLDVSFILDTLEYMHKGGRCSSVAALGANLLKLKPCIEVRSGAMGVGKKYRGKQIDVLMEYVDARLADADDIDPEMIFVTHSHTPPEIVEQVRQRVQSRIPFKNIFETRAGCTVSVHCGPNTLGILFARKTPLVK